MENTVWYSFVLLWGVFLAVIVAGVGSLGLSRSVSAVWMCWFLCLWSIIFCSQMSMPSCGVCRCAENLCSSGDW